MPGANRAATIGSPQRVVDVVVDLVAHRRYREARLQFIALERRLGLEQAARIVTEITALPASLDPRIETQARSAIPSDLPHWLQAPVIDEVGRICAGQPLSGTYDVALLARVVAASVIDAALAAEDQAANSFGAPVDLRSDAEVVDLPAPSPVVDISEPDRVFEAGPQSHTTDWLGRRL